MSNTREVTIKFLGDSDLSPTNSIILGNTEPVHTRLFRRDLPKETKEYLDGLNLKPGEFRGFQPLQPSYPTKHAPYCISEAYINCLLSSGFTPSQIAGMLQLDQPNQDNTTSDHEVVENIIHYLHTVIAGVKKDEFITYSSPMLQEDPVGKIQQRLLRANLIKSAKMYNGADIDPVQIYKGVIEKGDKVVILSGKHKHAVAIVGGRVEGRTNHQTPEARIEVVDPLNDLTLTLTLSDSSGNIITTDEQGGSSAPTHHSRSLDGFISFMQKTVQAATDNPQSNLILVSLNCFDAPPNPPTGNPPK